MAPAMSGAIDHEWLNERTSSQEFTLQRIVGDDGEIFHLGPLDGRFGHRKHVCRDNVSGEKRQDLFAMLGRDHASNMRPE